MKTLSAMLCLLCGLALPLASAAQQNVGEREQEAGARFERGVELYGEGNLDAALVQFERAYELIPNYRVLYNLAQLQAERHEYVAALSFYERYLEQGGDEVPEARRVESLAQIESLRERVGQLWVESDVAGAKLFVDDELVAELPLSSPIPINAGLRHVRLEKSGYTPVFRKLKVAGGDTPRVRIMLRAAVAGAAAPSDSTASAAGARPDYRPLWVASAATVALAGATVTMGLLARGENQDLDRSLDLFPGRPEEVQHHRSRVKTYAALTDGLGAVSLVSLGLSLYFAFSPPARSAVGREVSGRASSPGKSRLTTQFTGTGLVGSF
jgi:hypothetical protein